MRLAHTDLSAVLQQGSTVITPTSLLAFIADEQFNREQATQGKAAWERPAIYSLDAWMTACWQEARFSRDSVPILLSSIQEWELWRRVIEADRPDLFDPSSLANLARRSAQILEEYQISLDAEGWNDREDARQFQSWLRQVRAICKVNDWMIRSDLWLFLPDWTVGKPKFVGFSHLSPTLKRLGASTFSDAISRKAEAVCFESFVDQVEHAARAARELVEAGETSIAIFVPELARNSSLLKRTFNQVFYPCGADEVSPFHLSAQPLEKEPLIAGALLLLQLAKPRIDHAAAGAILRSPFIEGAKEERSARALADIQLRTARELDVSLSDMARAARDCQGVSKILKAVRTLVHGVPPRQSPSAWSRLFKGLLKACGWPNSDDHETAEKWEGALSELSGLGLVTVEMELNTAISRLREILSRPVQLGDWSSPVQILDASSAAGAQFDQAVVIGFEDEKFLRPTAVSPLLPFRLQRRHGVPGSSAEGLAELRDASARAVFSSAARVRATFSKELPLFTKPFIKGTPKNSRRLKQKFVAPELQEVEDAKGPPLSSPVIAGGARVIQAQSLCPFKAFAQYRLKARPPEDASFGYDALERGSFAHKALELVWKELESQQKLKAAGHQELRELVRRSVLEAVKSSETDGPLHHLSSIAERERLETLTLAWLDVEKGRQIPFKVEHIEEKTFFRVPGLQLDIRVDRVDRLPNGSTVLIDYKTGKQSKRKLENERPREPQLWVYAAALQEPVDGLLFGELTPTEPRVVGHAVGRHFKGGTKSGSIQDHKEQWDDFVRDSLKNVATLAQEFVSGVAVVRPLSSACVYCKTVPLCRINESTRLDEDDE